MKPKAKITKPNRNELIEGTTEIRGTATAPGFTKYTLSCAPGYDPRQLNPIGEYYTPVQNGKLADWDTTAVTDGDYIITLTVFDAQGTVAGDSVDVRLDNRPPYLAFSSPAPNGVVASPFEITGTVTDAHLKSWTLSAKSASPLLLAHLDGNTVNERTGEAGNLTGDPAYTQARFAQGLHITDAQGLTYPKDHNIEKEAGTIEFWLIPDWAGDQQSGHLLFQTKTANSANPKDCLKLSKEPSGLVFNVYDHEGKARSALIPTDSLSLPASSPAHIAATWDNGNLCLYLNGVPSTRVQGDGTGIIADLGNKLYVGFYPGVGREADAAFDELTIYDYARPLSTIRAACLAETPKLPGNTDSVVAGGTEPVEDALLGTATVTDGPAEALSLSLKAKDKNHHDSSASQTVFIDNPAPEAAISAPPEGAQVSGTVSVEGTCFDMDLASWTLSAKPGEASSPGTWTPVASGSEPVWRGAIADWDTSAHSGAASLKLEVSDAHGKTSVACRTVSVLSAGPLTADITTPTEGQAVDSPFQVTGTASGANFSGYTLDYREKSPSFLCHFNDNMANERDADSGTTTGSPRFEPGKFDSGLFVGGGDTLKYPTAGNISPQAGTIEMWVTPSWSASDSRTRMLVFTPPTSGYDNMLALAKGPGSLLFYTYDQAGRPKVVTTPVTDSDVQPGVPFHLGATWDDGDIRLYLNGRQALPAEGQSGSGIFSSLASDLYVGSGLFPGLGAEATIDELSIYPWVRPRAAILEDALATRQRTYHADWETAVSSSAPVTNGELGSVPNDPLPGEGIQIRLKASAAGRSEEDTVSLVRDSASPRADITYPEEGGLAYGVKNVRGTACDIDLASYQLFYKSGSDPGSPDPWVAIAPPAGQVVIQGTLAPWDTSGLSNGVHMLRLVVSDNNGKTATFDRAVSVNNRVPSARITFPTDGGGAPEVCEIRGTASGANFSSYTLACKSGTDPDAQGEWVRIGDTSTTPVTDGVLATWDTSMLSESPFVLRLTVTGLPGMVITDTVCLSVDHTAPRAEITAPEDGATVAGYVKISGTASDSHFGSYRLEYANETNPDDWQRVCDPVTTPITSGALGYWNVETVRDGAYLLRLSVRDSAGHLSEETIHLQVQNPPSYTVQSISIEPEGAMLAVGETARFTCLAEDAGGYYHLVTPAWEALGSNGSVDSAGLFTAGALGAGAVKATYQSFTTQVPTSVVTRIPSGVLSTSATWTAAMNPIVIDGWIVVPRNTTLALEQGTVIKFVRGGIYIEGSLVTQAMPGQTEVVFTSVRDDNHCGDTNADGNGSAPQSGGWSAVYFAAGSTSGIVAPARFLFGGANTNTTITGNRRVLCNSEMHYTWGTWTLSGCTFENSAGCGLTIAGNVILTGNNFINNGLWGCRAYGSSVNISGCDFYGGDYGLMSSGTLVIVNANRFNNVRTAIGAAGFARTGITQNTISGGALGILVDFDERTADAGGQAGIDVRENHISPGTSDGILVQSSIPSLVDATTHVDNNDITGKAGAGIRITNSTSRTTVSGNAIADCGWAVQAGSPGNVSIDNNTIQNSAYAGIHLGGGAHVGGTVTCSSNDITGRRGGGNAGIYILFYERSCFQQARLISNTISDTDQAFAGRSYKGQDYPPTALTIRDSTVTSSYGFADLWAFKDLVFENNNSTTEGSGVRLWGDEDDAFRSASARFSGNTINCSHMAILVNNYDNVDIGSDGQNAITGGGVGGNIIGGGSGQSFVARNNVLSGRYASLEVSGYAASTIVDNSLTGGGGISVGDRDHEGDCVINRNTLVNERGYHGYGAIRVSGEGRCVIQDNQVQNRFTNGIQVFGKSSIQIQRNTVEECGAGVEVQNSIGGTPASAVTDNYFYRCDKGGYFAICDAEVTRNTFTKGIIGLDVFGNVAELTPTLHHNRICENSYWGLINSSAVYQVGTRDDWWGSPSGPNPPGSGDRIDPERVNLFGFKGLRTRRGYCGWAGEPVNTSTGAFEYEHEDLRLTGRGPALNITRSYNSADPTKDTPLGYGWGFNYDCYLEEESYFTPDGMQSGWVTLTQNGYETMFFGNPDGGFTPQKGCFDTLTRVVDELDRTIGFTLVRKDHSTMRFTPITRYGETRYALDRLEDQNGNQLTLAYENGMLKTATDSGGRTLSFTWEEDSPVWTLTNHIVAVSDSAGRSVTYTYDDGGDLTSVTDARGNTTRYEYSPAHYLTKVIEPDGHVFLENHYKQQVDPDTPWQHMKVDWQRDGNGAETRFYYGIFVGDPDLGGWTMIVEPGEGWPTRHHRFDRDLNLHQDVSPEGFTTIYWYDEYGNRTKVRKPISNVTSMAYDWRGNLLSLTDALGNMNSFTYDGSDNLTSATDALNHATIYDYDENNNVVLTDYPDPRGSQAFTHWESGGGLGQLKSTTDSQGHETSYGYDQYGNLSQVTDPLQRLTAYDYSLVGLLTSTTDPLQHKTSFEYDEAGNLVKVEDPLSQEDPGGHHCVSYSYYPDDNLASFTDANGNRTSYTYDGNNQLASVTDAMNKSTSYEYDENWNLERIADARPEQYETIFSYDDDNRLTSIDDPSGDQPVTFDYYDNGMLKHVNQPPGERTGYTYYRNNLVHAITHASSPLSYSFTYTPTNQLETATDNAGMVCSLSYDTADRLTSTTDHNNPSRPGGFTLSYAYDDLSQLTGLSHPGLAETMSYTAAGELDDLTIPAGTIDFSYYLDGKVNGITTPDGTARSYTYDAAGRITEVKNQTASGTGTMTYTHDNNGNVRKVDGAETYRYDDLNRLTWWKNPDSGTITEYSYDQVGNLLQVKRNGVPIKTLAYNGSNEITTAGFTYDENGNMTSDGEKDYAYDAMNRLAEVKDQDTGQVIATYAYDYQGRRTRKTAGGETTYYHWDGNNLIAETNPSGAVKAAYTYDDSGNPLAMTRNEATYFYQTNSHGDVVTLTNSSGQVVNTYTYNPWGKVLTKSEQVENPIRYAGYIYDTETGLYYLMARYYDPGIGRFITRDPSELRSSRDPLSINKYSYCNGNPVYLVL